MKNRIFSILLAVVMLMSITTACASNPQSVTDPTPAPATTAPTAESTSTSEELPTEPDATMPDEPKLKVESIGWDARQLTVTEIIQFSEKMVELSTEDLEVKDICEMGFNFYHLFEAVFHKANFTDEASGPLAANAYEAFCNVIEQAETKQFNQSYLGPWSIVPNKDVLIKCYTTVKDDSIYLSCDSIRFGYLSEEDSYDVATTFLSCHSTKNSAYGILDCIFSTYPKVQQIGLDRMIELSKTSDDLPEMWQHQFFAILDDNSYANDVFTEEVLQEVRNNVLKNRYFDFVLKYITFCNSYDDDVAEYAFNRLVKIASSNPDEQTASSIRKVAEQLWDTEMSEQLLSALS